MSTWQTGDVVTNGIRTHYWRSGGNKPPLILLHGATDSGRCWMPIAKAFVGDFDVVLPDARGHGQSDAPPAGYTSTERAADVAGLIQALGLGKVAVGGHSMGGQTAFRLAADHADLVTCAVLEDPPFRLETEAAAAREPAARQAMREQVAQLRRLPGEAALAYGRQRHPNWPEAELPGWIEAKQQVSDRFLDAPRAVEEPWANVLPRITCPVLLITGDAGLGAIITPEVAEQARQLNSKVAVACLAGAGHNIRRERSDTFVTALRGFLALATVPV